VKQRLTFEQDPELATLGRFVFALDYPPERPFVVRVDGVIIKPRSVDGSYELEKTPKRWPESLEVEVCSGPFYDPPARMILAYAHMHQLDARLRAAHERMGGNNEGAPGEILDIIVNPPPESKV